MAKKITVVHPEGHADAGKPTGVIQFVADDNTVQELNVFALPAHIIQRLALHGASQKVGDSYAGAKDEPNPVQFMKDSVKGVIEQLVAGDWRAASAASGPRVSDLVRAYALATGESEEAALEFVGTCTDEEVKALRKKPKIAAALAGIAAKKAAEKAARLAEAAANATE